MSKKPRSSPGPAPVLAAPVEIVPPPQHASSRQASSRQASPPRDFRRTKADKPLMHREQVFVSEYLVLGVAKEAARRAGYSVVSNSAASDILRRPHVAKAIEDGLDEIRRRNAVTVDRVIVELAKLAFADPRDLFTDDGKLKPLHQLGDDSAASIAALDVLVVASGPRSAAARSRSRGAEDRAASGDAAAGTADAGGGDLALELRKIKRWDKTKALELLGRYLGLFKDRVELGVSQDLAATIEAARRRAQGNAAPGRDDAAAQSRSSRPGAKPAKVIEVD